jgi:transposase
MRPIKDILGLKHQHGLSVREVARSCGLPASTVGDYLQRAAAAGLGWPLPAELSETQLQEKLLGGVAPPVAHPATKAVPD